MKSFLLSLSLLLTLACKGQTHEKSGAASHEHAAGSEFAVQKTDAEWRAQLSELEYAVLRKGGTELAGSSPLLDIHEPGTYVCAGCGTPVFKSEHKYESGSGWPSFDREIEGNVAFSVDTSYGMRRVEEHCAVCGGHLGHVFDDGPRQTSGKRHCINGAALNFVPDR